MVYYILYIVYYIYVKPKFSVISIAVHNLMFLKNIKRRNEKNIYIYINPHIFHF